MVKLIPVKCPECGANLEIEEGRKTAFCTYCGAKILIHNENEHIVRNIDEAEILHAQNEKYRLETDRMAMVQEFSNEKKFSKGKLIFIWMIIAVLLLFLGFFFRDSGSKTLHDIGVVLLIVDAFGSIEFWCFFPSIAESMDKNKKKNKSGYIKFPDGADYYHGFGTKIHYQSATKMLVMSGFKNVKSINLCDLKPGNTKKEGYVSKITIDGDEIDDFDASYNPNAEFIIYYHGLPE